MCKLRFKTDNGSEFIGCFRDDKTRDGFEKRFAGSDTAISGYHRVRGVITGM